MHRTLEMLYEWPSYDGVGQGRIQDFLIGGSNLQGGGGFDSLILPDCYFFPDFFENSMKMK